MSKEETIIASNLSVAVVSIASIARKKINRLLKQYAPTHLIFALNFAVGLKEATSKLDS